MTNSWWRKTWRKSISGNGSSKCKGPEVGKNLRNKEKDTTVTLNLSELGSGYGITINVLRCDIDGQVIWETNMF